MFWRGGRSAEGPRRSGFGKMGAVVESLLFLGCVKSLKVD